jgi:hypothetical protein
MPTTERRESGAHLLIGTGASDDALGVVAASRAVQFESDPTRLVQRASEQSFDLIVLDVAMAPVESAIRSNARQSDVLITTRTRLLKAVREAATHAPGGVGVAAEIVERLFSVFRSQGTARSEARSTLPAKWIGTLVTKERSATEENTLRYRALVAAFDDRKKVLEDSLSTPEVASLLGSTRQTPHDRVKSKTLLAIEDSGQLRFPPWQFDASGPNGVVEGLPEVLRALSVGPLAQARWLTRKNPVLDGLTPLEMLKTGAYQRVVQEARGLAAQAGSRSG